MKRFLTSLIAVTITLGSMVPAFANEVASQAEVIVIEEKITEEKAAPVVDESKVKITKDEAKKIAVSKLKEYFGLNVDDKKFTLRIELRQDYEVRQVYMWDISYQLNSNEINMYASVAINANTGKIMAIGMNEYSYGKEKQAIADITEDQARVIAEEFINKINPDEFKETKNINDMYGKNRYGWYSPSSYNFIYARIVNGIGFDRNAISVVVDGVDGKVVSYNIRWDYDVEFPSVEDVITQDNAERIFRQQVSMNLVYTPYMNKYDYEAFPKTVKLIYMPTYGYATILDANDGTMVDWSGNITPEIITKDLTADEKEALIKATKPVKKLRKEIKKDRAEKVIQEKIAEFLGEGYQVQGLRYVENGENWDTRGKKAWSAHFNKVDNDRMYETGGYIVIDALTEELLSMYSYDYMEKYGEEFEPAITWEQAYDKAIEAMVKYYPGKLGDVITLQTYVKYEEEYNGKKIPQRYYYFNFPRVVNGIVYSDNSVSIGFDAKTGTIRDLRYNWDDNLEFPSADDAISAEDAQEIFFEKYKPELKYTMINKSKDYSKPEYEIKAVYTLNSTMYYSPMYSIDAFTGKFVDYDGQEVNEDAEAFKEKIKGHWAEKELNILGYNGMIDTAGFEPNKEITRVDAVKMLVNAKGYRPYMVRDAEALKFSNVGKEDQNYKYLQLAIKYGIMENAEGEFDFNEKITREEMAEMLVKFLEYDKLAKATDIFAPIFDDASQISKEKVGYVAICKGLGILNGSNGKFRPQDNVTMAEFAVAAYRTLGNLKSPIYYY